jgi:16S rRNA (adenine1518-N6/adenine1519-N6)-dimethyltransferase
MLQDEVASRITSKPGEADYGFLTVLVQFYCEASRLFRAPPSAFNPPPKVWSAVVRLAMRESPAAVVEDEEDFFRFVGAAFAQRRKTIFNNLKAYSAQHGAGRSPEEAFRRSQIDPKRRAETLSVGEFAALYKLYRAVS